MSILKSIERFTPCDVCPAKDVLAERGSIVRADFNHAVNSLSRTYYVKELGPDDAAVRGIANRYDISDLSAEIVTCAQARALGECIMAAEIE